MVTLALLAVALAQSPPLPPDVPTKPVPYSQEYQRMLTAKPRSFTPLLVTGGFRINGLTVTKGGMSLSWSGSTNTVQLQGRSYLADDWRNIGIPTIANPITFDSTSSMAMFRLEEVTNQIDLGPWYVGTQYASTNGQGLSAMVVYDPSSPKLVIWDRQKHVNYYDLPGIDNTSVGVSCETAWVSGHLVVAFVPGNNLSLQINEYSFSPNPVLVSSLRTGNANARWVDCITLSSGVVAVSVYQQTNDLVGWFCHRTVQGQWVDDGEVSISGGYANPAGMIRIAEMPTDKSLWVFSTKDGGGSLRASRVSFSPTFHWITNFTLCSDAQTTQPPDHIWANDTNMAPHPEYLIQMKAAGDVTTGKIRVAYPNWLGATRWSDGTLLTKIVELETDGIGKVQTCLTTGVTERVAGGIALGSRIIYPPMTQSLMPYYPMTVFDGSKSTLQFPLINYNNEYQDRGLRDAIGVRDDGNLVIALHN